MCISVFWFCIWQIWMVNWRQVSPALVHFKICKLLQYSDENWIWWALVMLSSPGLHLLCLPLLHQGCWKEKNTSLLGLSKAASGKQLFWKGNDWNHSGFCSTEQKRDTIETGMLWKDWGRLIFLPEPPPPFSHVGTYCSPRHKYGTELCLGKRAEINFKGSQTSIFSQGKHYKCIV